MFRYGCLLPRDSVGLCFFFASAHLMRALIVYNMYTHTYMHTYTHIHTTRHTHTHMHAYTHIHACMHTHASLHIYIHNTYTHMHTYSHTYKYMHACMHTHAHVYRHTLTDMHTYIPTPLPSIQTQSKPPPGPWTYLFHICTFDKSFKSVH